MIDGNDAEQGAGGGSDGHGGVVEGGIDVVDGDGVVRVRGVAGDVADDAEVARGRIEAGGADEGWDWFGEVDAVDEDLRKKTHVSRPCSKRVSRQ